VHQLTTRKVPKRPIANILKPQERWSRLVIADHTEKLHCFELLGVPRVSLSDHSAHKVAKLFSNVFSPFSVAAIVCVVFSWFSPIGIGPFLSPFLSAAIGLATLCILPFLPIAYGVRTGEIDLDVSDLKKRVPLYLPGLAWYAIGASVFWILNSKIMFVIALAYLCVASATFTITLVWKISAHTAGVAGPITALVFVFGPSVLPLHVLSLVMVWSRVKLGAHTLNQAVAGVLVAIAVTSCVYYISYP
jgi:membrane-associated phospholipid phosphatase